MVSMSDWSEILDPRGRWSPLVHLGATPALVARHNAGIAYLATPYTRQVMIRGKWSVERSVMMSLLASRHVHMLRREGVSTLSPVVLWSEAVHSQHTVPGRRVNPLDVEEWTSWCRPFLRAAAMVVVPDIPGWDQSAGVWGDVQHALTYNVPVFIYGGQPDGGS